METYNDQGLDSPSRNSYIGSYYQPPDKIIPLPRRLDFPFHTLVETEQPTTSPRVSQSKTNIDSKAVVNALKTLQEKIRRVELETSRQTERSQQISQDVQMQKQATVLTCQHITQKHKDACGKTQLDPVERCKRLQKQTEKVNRSFCRAQREQTVLMQNQTLLQNEQLNSNIQKQNEKLEKLESECEKLSKTQTQSELKLALLEEKLQREEHERRLVQEKADELQREFNSTLRLSTEKIKVKRKTKKITKNTLRENELKSPNLSTNIKMPFVAGTSTSPSHSVHANVQSVLHMMKHHQPHLHERVTALHKSSFAAKKSLHKEFSQSNIVLRHHSESSDTQESHGSLSDLVLALQDELGQMSFEYRELMHQIDDTDDHKKKQDLKNELERLVTRMDEKGAQITKLRKHQRMVYKLTKDSHQASCDEETHRTTVIHPPAPSPVKAKKKGRKQPQSNLQLLRETQQFRNSLKQCDLFWET